MAPYMQVDYRDGDQETVWLPLEQVRLSMHSGEELQRPSSAAMQDWAAALASQADPAQPGAGGGSEPALPGVSEGQVCFAWCV